MVYSAHHIGKLALGQKKKKSMFPVVHPKTAMHDVVFTFNFINRKTAMRNLFINRTGRYTHTNNHIDRGPTLFVISFAEISQKKTQIFDLLMSSACSGQKIM